MAAVPVFQTAPWVVGLFYAALGFAFGVLAERTNYCVVIATHQVMGVRYSRIYEMILVGVALSALLTGVLVASGAVPAVDAYAYMPGAGWYTVLGSFIFGFGIMLGQGCMVGMLWKSGQGYVVNWLEILGMMVGTIIFSFPIYAGLNLGVWWHTTNSLSIADGSPANYVPYLLSGALPLRAAALLAGVLFFAGVMFVVWRLRRNRLEFEGREDLKKSPLLYGVLFGLFMVASFVFLAGRGFNYLGVTTPVGLLAEYAVAPFGEPSMPKNWFQSVPVLNPFTFFVLMVVAGAAVASIVRGTFSIKLPPPGTNRAAELGLAFVGGVILAIGARMAQGCSVGGFWSGLAGLSLFGLLFTLGFIPGTIAGYYAYVFLSSRAARKAGEPRLRINLEPRKAGAAFAAVWGLVLIGVGLYAMRYGPLMSKAMPPAVALQYGYVLIGAGIFVALAGAVAAALRRRK
ncbi:hypothetical protein TUZN_0974 [Thermoproteus uzoniensis 768-20]|uniref:Uncharacterized protein n=1 Tax=Thermoproteus uzoniensis (strain 768-20) TaxID=999630 RepID=F2L611_THEU7|nr:YeeE/YedE family protein [Thermoproteus uzoniensis]AEA12456.1 hypothetical protein TUZN_0974 [Thermoproteus uzoniensis 768-20]